jgi:hypothetical protein
MVFRHNLSLRGLPTESECRMTRTAIPRSERGTISSTSHHKGLDATRSAIASAVAGNWSEAERYAERRWGTKSRAARVTKDVSAMLTTKADLPGFNTQVTVALNCLGPMGRLPMQSSSMSLWLHPSSVACPFVGFRSTFRSSRKTSSAAYRGKAKAKPTSTLL